jgi:PAS domain S-box-containing protein
VNFANAVLVAATYLRQPDMQGQVEDPAQEIKRLQRCINDLIGLLALPATWVGSEPSRIVGSLVDALVNMLGLDVVYVRLGPAISEGLEFLRTSSTWQEMSEPRDVCETIRSWLGDGQENWPEPFRKTFQPHHLSIVPLQLGLQGEVGVLVAGSERTDFPQQTERLILSVAANQASLALQEARLLGEQRRLSSELDQRVVQRTAELAAANAELQLQVGLLQHLPVSAWTLKSDGTPDFVNQVWLEFAGQTADFVRSHPEAWMTAVHPEDRERASKTFWQGVHSGQGFAFETRSLRAQDGSYRWHLQQAVVLRDAQGKVLKFVGTTTDIDDQKRAQEELRASEVNLRRVIDAIPTLAWCNLPDGPNEFLSKGWHEYTGLAPEESHGWGWSAALHPDDLPPLMEKWRKMLVSGESDEIEARLRRHDGVYRWFLIRAQAFRDDAGKIVRWYGTSTDIEDRKRAEEARRASERNLEAIINTIPSNAWTARGDGYCDFLNQGWLDYSGMTSGQAEGWGWAEAIHPDDRKKLVEEWQSCLASGTPVDTEARIRRFDGAYRWFLIRANPLRDESGNILKWYGTCTDIDDRKRGEEVLHDREQSMRFVLDGIAGQVAIMTAMGGVEAVNRQVLDYFGKSIEEMKGWSTSDSVHPDDLPGVISAWRHSMETLSRYDVDHRLRRSDGVYRWFHARGLPLLDDDDRLVRWYVLLTDIDDRKRAEEELRAAQSELARVMRVMTMGQLTASIAHEVNQPLSGIITNANTCMRMLDANPPNVDGARETVRRTIRDGNRAADVVRRLRTLYSKQEPALESMDLNEAAREVTALSSSDIQRNGVTLRQEFADDLPLVIGDRIQLQQVILNLLRNAADAMSKIDDRPRELLIRTEKDEKNNIRLSVKDSGVGLTAEAADKIFEAFYTTKTDGMGIGLSVSRSIIEAHQGHLWATTNDGHGSTFSFSIPCRPLGSNDAETPMHSVGPSTDAA